MDPTIATQQVLAPAPTPTAATSDTSASISNSDASFASLMDHISMISKKFIALVILAIIYACVQAFNLYTTFKLGHDVADAANKIPTQPP